jgi:hypothetical protein
MPTSMLSLFSDSRAGLRIWKPRPSGVIPLKSRSMMLGARKAVAFEIEPRYIPARGRLRLGLGLGIARADGGGESLGGVVGVLDEDPLTAVGGVRRARPGSVLFEDTLEVEGGGDRRGAGGSANEGDREEGPQGDRRARVAGVEHVVLEVLRTVGQKVLVTNGLGYFGPEPVRFDVGEDQAVDDDLSVGSGTGAEGRPGVDVDEERVVTLVVLRVEADIHGAGRRGFESRRRIA